MDVQVADPAHVQVKHAAEDPLLVTGRPQQAGRSRQAAAGRAQGQRAPCVVAAKMCRTVGTPRKAARAESSMRARASTPASSNALLGLGCSRTRTSYDSSRSGVQEAIQNVDCDQHASAGRVVRRGSGSRAHREARAPA
eukprot:1127859-Pleurochrysis_carterae.AAC.2